MKRRAPGGTFAVWMAAIEGTNLLRRVRQAFNTKASIIRESNVPTQDVIVDSKMNPA